MYILCVYVCMYVYIYIYIYITLYKMTHMAQLVDASAQSCLNTCEPCCPKQNNTHLDYELDPEWSGCLLRQCTRSYAYEPLLAVR